MSSINIAGGDMPLSIGTYACIAENELGRDTATIDVLQEEGQENAKKTMTVAITAATAIFAMVVFLGSYVVYRRQSLFSNKEILRYTEGEESCSGLEGNATYASVGLINS